MPFGDYTAKQFCPEGYSVCGINAQIEGNQKGDYYSPLKMGVVSLIGQSAESIQFMMLVRMMYLTLTSFSTNDRVRLVVKNVSCEGWTDSSVSLSHSPSDVVTTTA